MKKKERDTESIPAKNYDLWRSDKEVVSAVRK